MVSRRNIFVGFTMVKNLLLLFRMITGNMLPEGHRLPNTHVKIRRILKDLGFSYIKIHVCRYDCPRASLGSNGRYSFIDCGAASISRPISTSITRTCSKSRFRSRSGRRYGRLPGDSLFSLAVAHSGTVLLWCWYFYGDVEVYTYLEVFTEQVAQIKSTLKYLQNFLKVVYMTLLDLTELLVEVHEQHAKDIANLKTEIASLNAEIKQLKKDT
ncbi:hypothetical protein OROGR_012738 [Orobanche gracilis]